MLAVLALSQAACGDDDDETDRAGTTATGTAETQPEQPARAPVETIAVRETDFELDPQNARVAKTGVVEFRVSNEGEVEHNLEVETPQGEFELEENIPPGETATFRAELEEPGEYVWYCPVGDHRERGMEGTVTVAGGGTGGKKDEGESESGGAAAPDSGY